MRLGPAAAVAVLIGACARGGNLSVTMVGVDTVRVSVAARAGRCPTGPGWLVEALDTAMALLLWLPADTPAEQRVQRSEGFDRPRAVLQRASRRAIDSYRADSGRIVLDPARSWSIGRLDLHFEQVTVTGRFRTPPPALDATACVPQKRDSG